MRISDWSSDVCSSDLIDLNRSVLQRSNEIVGRVHQREQVAAVRPALAIGNSDERFDRRVARARPHASKARVDSHRTRFDGNERVGNSKRKVMMRMDRKSTRLNYYH